MGVSQGIAKEARCWAEERREDEEVMERGKLMEYFVKVNRIISLFGWKLTRGTNWM